MKVNVFLIIVLIMLSITSCKDDAPKTTYKQMQVELKANEQYQYDTRIGGDEEGAGISSQASHFEISEIIRDNSTGFSAVYNYLPEVDYVGTDEVELKLSTHSYGSSASTHIDFIRISFSISE